MWHNSRKNARKLQYVRFISVKEHTYHLVDIDMLKNESTK